MAYLADPYFDRLSELLASATSKTALYEAVVNAPFHDLVQATHLDMGIVVLLLVNPNTHSIDRIALSDTEQAKGAVKMSEKPFSSIKIPLNHTGNLIAKVIASHKPQATSDWKDLFVPALGTQAARFNQAGGGIECSFIYPLTANHGGALIFSYYQPLSNIGAIHKAFMAKYRDIVDQRLRSQN